MTNQHDSNEDEDVEAQLRRFLDETRTRLEGQPDDLATLFPKVDFPDRLLGASEEERERFLWAAAHRAVFDPDPHWRTADMPSRVLRELQSTGVSPAVQAWVAYVLREGEIPHCKDHRRPADMFAQSDYRHNLAVFILDNETKPEYQTKAGRVKITALLEAAANALPKGDSAARQMYYSDGFRDYLDSCRRQRAYLKKVGLSK